MEKKDVPLQKAKPQIGLGLFIPLFIIGLFLTFWSFKIGQNQHPNAKEIKLSAPDPKTPAGIVQVFYEEYKRQRENWKDPKLVPIEEIIKETPYVTERFRAHVLSTYQTFSFDPLICSQDIPVRFDVKTAEVYDDKATVMVRTFYSVSESIISTYLQKVNGWWRVDKIECLNFPM